MADTLLLRDAKDGHTSALARAHKWLMDSEEFCFVYEGASILVIIQAGVKVTSDKMTVMKRVLLLLLD